mmetsp:Transcript_3974/g.11013  ORF Transcript_3974/g.11013 Transcript_3974/m.11013 type:complete len:260 (-) Transcript_3974:238-1017(-)
MVCVRLGLLHPGHQCVHLCEDTLGLPRLPLGGQGNRQSRRHLRPHPGVRSVCPAPAPALGHGGARAAAGGALPPRAHGAVHRVRPRPERREDLHRTAPQLGRCMQRPGAAGTLQPVCGGGRPGAALRRRLRAEHGHAGHRLLDRVAGLCRLHAGLQPHQRPPPRLCGLLRTGSCLRDPCHLRRGLQQAAGVSPVMDVAGGGHAWYGRHPAIAYCQGQHATPPGVAAARPGRRLFQLAQSAQVIPKMSLPGPVSRVGLHV